MSPVSHTLYRICRHSVLFYMSLESSFVLKNIHPGKNSPCGPEIASIVFCTEISKEEVMKNYVICWGNVAYWRCRSFLSDDNKTRRKIKFKNLSRTFVSVLFLTFVNTKGRIHSRKKIVGGRGHFFACSNTSKSAIKFFCKVGRGIPWPIQYTLKT